MDQFKLDTSLIDFYGFKFEYHKNDNMANNSIKDGKMWEPHITTFVKLYNLFYNIQNIIDIGANFGYHTLFFSKEVQGTVFAFEPQIQNFQLLQKNINYNLSKNIEIYNFACGDIECDVKMDIILQNNNDKLNMGDFTPDVCNSQFFSMTKSLLLDYFEFPQIDLIKIDTQGWEKKVLIGCKELLKKYKPILIVEFEHFQLIKTNTSCEELFDFIRNNNYYIFFLEYNYPSDHICVHNDNLNDFRNKFKKYIHVHNSDNEINHNLQYFVNEKIVLNF